MRSLLAAIGFGSLEGQQGLENRSWGTQIRWNLPARVGFRFLFSYLSLICFKTVAIVVMIGTYLITNDRARMNADFLDPILDKLVPWFGKYFLHLNVPNYHGDAPADWVFLLIVVLISVVATVVWSVLDKDRPNYIWLHEWLRVGVRFALAGAMTVYGADKIFPLQFGPMSLSRLSATVGTLTPQEMLWLFMASSGYYTIMSGLGELTGAFLLIFPRLANLGALVVIGVMTNVFAMNVFYDVSVKIMAFHYLMMAVFLVTPDMRRLADVLVFNRAVQPALHPPLFRSRGMNRLAVAIQLLVGGLFLFLCINGTRQIWAKQVQDLKERSPLYGIWAASDFEVTKNGTPSSGENSWHRLIFDAPGSAQIESNSGESQTVEVGLDTGKQTLAFSGSPEPYLNASVHFERPEPTELVLDGTVGDGKVHAVFRRVDESKFPLTNTPIQWVRPPHRER